MPTAAQLRRARRFARDRAGLVSFAAVDTAGRLRCLACRRRHVTAGAGEAVLLVSHRVRAEPWTPGSGERALLEPSGDEPLYRLARRAGMRRFDADAYWANAQLISADRARLGIAVLTAGTPSRGYGRETLRGVAARLLGETGGGRARREGRRDRRGTGRLAVVPGFSERLGRGPVRRFVVEVESGLREDRAAFAGEVEEVLAHRRSWGGSGHVGFRRVSRGPASFRVTLASPPTTDRLCLPLLTNGIFSCYMAGRVVINAWRWRRGAAAYAGRLRDYRTYVVNHEVGHALGRGHALCPGAGSRAPVMMQQTMGVAPCRANPWPLPSERG